MHQSSSVRIVRAETIGPIRLTDADGRDVTPRGRKARALILYLLHASGHAETRRNLIGLLWGDRGDEQARQSLRQTLYELRPLMTDPCPLVGADRTSVWLDATFLSLSSRDRSLPAAGTTIATDLDGVSPAFDRWLLGERQKSDVPPAKVADLAPSIATGAQWTAGTGGARRWRMPVLVIALLAALASIVVGLARSRVSADSRRIVVVQPLRTAPGDVVARRLSQDLASDLSRAVLGHDGMLEFADGASVTRKAAFIVTGNVASDGSDLHAVVAVSGSSDATILWSHDYTAALADRAGLRQQITTNLAAVLVCALGTRGVPDAVDARATALYLEACNLHSGDQLRAADLLRQVTVRAPLFASGWADLAIALAFASDDADAKEAEAMRREAVDAARRALSIDPHEGNAYYAQALLLPGIEHWIARERLIGAGLKAEPDNPQLYSRRAIDLAAIGRSKDSIAAGRRAVALDPLFPGKTAQLIRSLANAGELDEANKAIRQMRETWPDNHYTWHARFATASRIGDPREAAAMLDDPAQTEIDRTRIGPWQIFLRARSSPTAANVDGAVAALLEQRRLGAVDDGQIVSDLTLLGRPAEALDIALRMPLQQESDFWFRRFLRPLRADPRFMIVARTQGLLAIWRATNLWPDFCRDGSVRYDCRKVVDTLSTANG